MASLKARKRLMYIMFGFIFLFGGIEYAVILPTLWLYLHNEYDAPEYMLGLVLSAYSVASFISSPVFGRLSDKTRRTKVLILSCIMFELGGSFLYFTDISQYMCLASRFIAGLGAAGEAIVFAEVARYTTNKERTGIISKLAAIRQMALLLGPGLNIFLRLADFDLGPFSVTKYTSPAGFMVVMWAILLFLVLVFYIEPSQVYEACRDQPADASIHVDENENPPAMANNGPVNYYSEDGRLTDGSTTLLGPEARNPSNGGYITRSSQALDDPIALEGKMGFFCNEYIRDEIVAVMYLFFCAMFSQVCVETMVTPLALKYLEFGEFENSLLYCACGVEIIAVFMVVSSVSRCVSDRNMLVFGLVVLLCSNIWLLYFLPQAPEADRAANLPLFSMAVFLDVLSLPFLFVCSTSLYSKLTRPQTQGLSQGLRRSVVGMGTILGPLWGSATVDSPYLLFGVLVAMQGLAMVLLLLSYKRMKPSNFSETQGDDVQVVNTDGVPSGNTPLYSEADRRVNYGAVGTVERVESTSSYRA